MTDNQPERPQGADDQAQGSAPPTGPAQADRAAARRHSRRRLVKAGLAAVPVVLTLPSRSAWGQGGGPNGTNVTPVSAARNQGMSEEQIQQLKLQLLQAEAASGAGGWDDDGDASDE